MTQFCGTGGYTGPGPGDPSNPVGISAAGAFGGIDVFWNLPGINPHAVAYYKLYRGLSPDFDNATVRAHVNGDNYYDRIPGSTGIFYYYWVTVVSANTGVESIDSPVGPASATSRPVIQDVMVGLTQQIDEGFLAQSLKQEIGKIDFNRQEYLAGLAQLAETDDALGVAFSQVLAVSEAAAAAISEEAIARTSALNAMASSQNTLQAQVNDFYAAVNVQMGAVTKVDSQGNLISSGAIFAPTVDVNGVIGGFGIYNDGSIVEMGFDVDRFWVGRTSTVPGGHHGVKPFIIEGGETFINEAVINKLTFNKLRSEDGSLAFTPATYNSAGNLVTPGKLKVEYIDAANLTVNAVQVSGLGSLATQNNVNANQVANVAPSINLVNGNIMAGKTSATSTNAGYFMGFTGSTPYFHVGNASRSMVWDGSNLGINGDIIASGNIVAGGITRAATTASSSDSYEISATVSGLENANLQSVYFVSTYFSGYYNRQSTDTLINMKNLRIAIERRFLINGSWSAWSELLPTIQVTRWGSTSGGTTNYTIGSSGITTNFYGRLFSASGTTQMQVRMIYKGYPGTATGWTNLGFSEDAIAGSNPPDSGYGPVRAIFGGVFLR